jgi:hypothetical protein
MVEVHLLQKRAETTTSCGLNPTVKGIPTERLETTTSCGLNPTVKGIPTKKARGNNELWPSFHHVNGNCDQSNVYVLVKEFFIKIHEKASGLSENS